MANKKYTLYLDESETHVHDKVKNKDTKFHFCMAGMIIADDDYIKLENDIKNLKKNIWSDMPNPENIILHQMRILEAEKGRLDVSKFPEYNRFRGKDNRRLFYNELKSIFCNNDLTIVGSSICEDDLNKFFNISSNRIDKYLISLQLLIENYCHFLCENNGIGSIIYEARGPKSDESLRDRFYTIKLMGSMYINKKTMEKRLLGIDFISKGNNNVGLQVADFVPNSFAKDHVGSDQSRPNIFSVLKYYRYDGGGHSKDRFGVKKMP